MERLGVRIGESSQMDSVIDKEQRLSEGHSEAEDRKMDFEDLTGDEEVAVSLPRKGAEEREPSGEEIRDLPGATVSVIEEPRGLGTEATGGIYGLKATEGGMRAPTPQLPPPRQDMPGAGVVTPPEERC